jgi:CubicO group peptidase (beta-lactamase class C family)
MLGMSGTDTVLGHQLARLVGAGVPGVSAALVRGGEGIELGAAGYSDLVGQRVASPDTVYLWFSMTKIVTATATMQLAEQKALSLDDPVGRHLPEFPTPRSGWPEVRVRHLLSHSSGLANPMPVRWVHRADQPGRSSRDFALELLRRHSRLRHPAGRRAAYSNLGYIALGEVIAAASGRAYEDYVRARILEPLGMTATGFTYDTAREEDIATGYQKRLHPMTPLFRLLLPRGIVGPASGGYLAFNRFHVDGPAYGGLLGSVRDAARFMAVHLHQGAYDGVRLLSAESVAEMQTRKASGRRLDVGIGWFRRGGDRTSGEFWEHLGGGGGFWSMMRIYPARRIGVLTMGNATRYDHDAVAASVT